MIKFSKRIISLKKLVLPATYALKDGLDLVKQVSTAKFIESIEIHVCTNLKSLSTKVHSVVNLPHEIGKDRKLIIAVFTKPENFEHALACGATFVGYHDLLLTISKREINFDVLITSKELLPQLSAYSKILIQKNAYPSLELGTITDDIAKSIYNINTSRVEYMPDKFGIIHTIFGTTNLTTSLLKENFLAIYTSINKSIRSLPFNGKEPLRSCVICSTMSPSIKIDIKSIK